MNRKSKLVLFLLLLSGLVATGCDRNEEVEALQNLPKEEKAFEELKFVAEQYRDIYEKALNINEANAVETMRQIAEHLGECGYTVADNDNLINMQNPEQLESFVEQVENSERSEMTFYLLMADGGIVRYELKTVDGQIRVVRNSLIWSNGEMRPGVYEEFQVQRWDYTEKGWLFLEQYHPEGYDGPPGQIGIRVKALDEDLRELNQKYVAPIGYGCNNLLITDWNETDYSAVDFYDLFEIMYRMKFGTPFSDNGGVSAVEYWIPAEEFENVLQTYLDVDADFLREKMDFDLDRLMYRYRPRTMDDMEMPYGPEPEVVACEKQKDGTLKLEVEAVWIREFSDCVISSELVVRPMRDGTFHYVSNQVNSIDDKLGVSWRKERLTDEEWELLWAE